VTLPSDTPLQPWNDVAISASMHPRADTHVEFFTYGRQADFMSTLFTLLVGDGTRLTRPLKLLGEVIRHPIRALQTLWPWGWSRRTVLLLVMQSLDNAISFRAKRRWWGEGVTLSTQQDPERPNPTYIEAATQAARWLQQRTKGQGQSALLEALANIPTTAHLIGGAVIGSDATRGVVDQHNQVFAYQRLLVCDGSTMPANPGVNPALTITAIAEHAMSHIPGAPGS